MNGSFGKSQSSQQSNPLTPQQVQGYFDQLDTNTGGNLSGYASNEFAPVEFKALTPEELTSIGGAGATRQLGLQTSRNDATQQTAADPSLSVFQRGRSNQLTNNDFNDRSDAIAKETEALLTQLASQQNSESFNAGVTNKNLEREKLIALANIFFGGKGQSSSGSSNSISLSGGMTTPAPAATGG